MADIQSVTAEIRRGKKIEKEETTRRKYNGLPYSIGRPSGHNKTECTVTVFVFDCRNSAQGNEHEVCPTIQMRHAALERNKRCLLTYLYVPYDIHKVTSCEFCACTK